MTREDIIRIAEENGIVIIGEAMFRFAALVEKHVEQRMLKAMELYGRTERENGAAQEREACAKICESLATDRGRFHPDDEELKIGVLAGAGMCGATIRARGAQ